MNKETKEHLKSKVDQSKLAQAVVTNPIYRSSFESINAKIYNRFCQSKYDEPEVREEAWRQMQVLIEMQAYFNHLLETGKAHEETLKAQEEHERWLDGKGKLQGVA